MAKSKASSFTAYIEAKQRWERRNQAIPVAGWTALSILVVLAGNAEQPMPLPDLQATSDLSFFIFAKAIKRAAVDRRAAPALLDSDCIVLAGVPGSESAQLTTLGAEVALLARPA
jgi:hypothetical protein